MPRSLRLWTPRSGTGKPGPNSQVDWTNPLARGLVGLWLFNEGAGLTIRNYAAPHRDAFTADVTGLYAPEVEGLGFNGGLTHYASLLSPSAALKPTQATIFWRGLILGAPGADSNGPAVAGGYFDTANSTPFNTFSIDRINPADIIFEYNVGGSYNSITLTSGASGTNAIMDFALTVASSGATGYKNGVSAGTGAGGSITYGATANYRINRHGATSVTDDANSFAQVVAIWNRALRAAEVQALHLDPYALLVPEEVARNIWLLPTRIASGTDHALSGSILTSDALAGTLTADKPLSGTITTSDSLSAALTTDKPLAGTITTSGALSAILTAEKPLSGAALTSDSLVATLTTEKPLSGAIATADALSAALVAEKPLSGIIATSDALSGTLTVDLPGNQHALSGAIATSDSLAGILTVDKALSGVVTTSDALLAALTVDKPLAGIILTSIALSAILTVTTPVGSTVTLSLSDVVVTALTLSDSAVTTLSLSDVVVTALTLSDEGA